MQGILLSCGKSYGKKTKTTKAVFLFIPRLNLKLCFLTAIKCCIFKLQPEKAVFS